MEDLPMLHRIVALSFGVAGVLASPAAVEAKPATLRSVGVTLPDDTSRFPGPGADAISNNCLACHSTDMILNQPALTNAAWKAEVNKMINVYKAPVAQKDIDAIVDYLSRTEGKQ
jgi:hypothetical protein